MNCKKAEKWLLRSFDGLLGSEEARRLEEHLAACRMCREKEREYRDIFGVFQAEPSVSPLPFFWERLEFKLEQGTQVFPGILWKKWCLRAIPVSLVLIVVLVVSMLFIFTPRDEELSQSEVLLLRNTNPLLEARRLFEEERIEDRNMMLIFTAVGENGVRRYIP